MTDPVARCAALGDPMRWQILTLLGSRPRSATALAAELPVSRQAIGKHLDALVRAGLVSRDRQGSEVRFSALGGELSQLAAALDELGRGWERRLREIKRAAESQDAD